MPHPEPELAYLASPRPDNVAQGFTSSPEYCTNLVTAAYQKLLRRAPDAQGLAFWVNRLQQGLSDEQMEAAFISSPEYLQHHGGPGEAWIRSLYQDVLGRTADTAGLTFWQQALANGLTPAEVAQGFTASTEREGQRVGDDYQRFLGRAPTAVEVESGVDQLRHGRGNEDLIVRLVTSDEYIARHGPAFYANQHVADPEADYHILNDLVGRVVTEDQYLQDRGGTSPDWLLGLYQDVLGRKPETPGLNFWLEKLGSGDTVGEPFFPLDPVGRPGQPVGGPVVLYGA
jgi:hypothetical protein